MSLEFLSDEWFAKVEELKAEAGDLETPAALQELVININVDDKQLHLAGGMIEKGHADNAPTTMTLPGELAKRIFIENDQSAGMQGFMAGQITVEGDMSKLMAMQTVQPSDKQKALMGKVQELTN